MSKISPMIKKVASFVFSKPATSGYPYEKRQLADDYRGQMHLDLKSCVGCGLCKKDCPGGAIEYGRLLRKKPPTIQPIQMLILLPMNGELPQKSHTQLNCL